MSQKKTCLVLEDSFDLMALIEDELLMSLALGAHAPCRC